MDKIDNKDLLYSTGYSSQYSVLIYTGKKIFKRVDIHVCINDHFAVQQKLKTF